VGFLFLLAEVLFAFENIGFYGNAMYLDNIKVFNKTSSNLSKVIITEDNIDVYPNPSKDILNVKFNAIHQKIDRLVLRDNLGRIIWAKEKPNNKLEVIQLQNYTKGVYYLSIIGEKNTIGRKIIIDID
jgi:serine protease AprX